MFFRLNELSRYCHVDNEKLQLIRQAFSEIAVLDTIENSYSDEYNYQVPEKKSIEKKLSAPTNSDSRKILLNAPEADSKYCPKCGLIFPKYETICPQCLVHLKSFSEEINVRDIEFKPEFTFKAKNEYDTFESIFDQENFLKVNNFKFTYGDFEDILFNIKKQAFSNFNDLIKRHNLDFDSLEILEKIIIFTKSFVKVDYKSSGSQLGYFEKDAVYIDDRQTKSLQITTLIHELAHFILKEILTFVLCSILDMSRNSLIESVVIFILSYSHFTQLIDEYSAHNVEGRFTIFGYQDYSSFRQIENSLEDEMSKDEIEITKMIGNTFANSIKEILESLLDWELREDIKNQFLNDVLDKPNYRELEMENCQILNQEGFIKAIWLILNEGFENASANTDMLVNITQN